MAVGVEHDYVLLLLGREALVNAVSVAVVENIVALDSVILAKVVLELVICVVKHAVAIKIEPDRPMFPAGEGKQTVIEYARVFHTEIDHVIYRDQSLIGDIVAQARG